VASGASSFGFFGSYALAFHIRCIAPHTGQRAGSALPCREIHTFPQASHLQRILPQTLRVDIIAPFIEKLY
jgi:hypothetical protein